MFICDTVQVLQTMQHNQICIRVYLSQLVYTLTITALCKLFFGMTSSLLQVCACFQIDRPKQKILTTISCPGCILLVCIMRYVAPDCVVVNNICPSVQHLTGGSLTASVSVPARCQ